MDFFPYGEAELAYLKKRDKRMAWAIERIGMIQRPIIPDLFQALVHAIIGQQISTKAHTTIWGKVQLLTEDITPQSILTLTPEMLQSIGISFKKVGYIRGIAQTMAEGNLSKSQLQGMTDKEICQTLSALSGIGTWTAEMIMLHTLLRPDVFSCGDFGILRGLRMLYRHKEIDKKRFERYRKRFSPYGSVVCLYLWAIASGTIEELTDPIVKQSKRNLK